MDIAFAAVGSQSWPSTVVLSLRVHLCSINSLVSRSVPFCATRILRAETMPQSFWCIISIFLLKARHQDRTLIVRSNEPLSVFFFYRNKRYTRYSYNSRFNYSIQFPGSRHEAKCIIAGGYLAFCLKGLLSDNDELERSSSRERRRGGSSASNRFTRLLNALWRERNVSTVAWWSGEIIIKRNAPCRAIHREQIPNEKLRRKTSKRLGALARLDSKVRSVVFAFCDRCRLEYQTRAIRSCRNMVRVYMRFVMQMRTKLKMWIFRWNAMNANWHKFISRRVYN